MGPNGGKLDSVKIDSFTGDPHAKDVSLWHAMATLAKQCTHIIPYCKEGVVTLELTCGTMHGLRARDYAAKTCCRTSHHADQVRVSTCRASSRGVQASGLGCAHPIHRAPHHRNSWVQEAGCRYACGPFKEHETLRCILTQLQSCTLRSVHRSLRRDGSRSDSGSATLPM